MKWNVNSIEVHSQLNCKHPLDWCIGGCRFIVAHPYEVLLESMSKFLFDDLGHHAKNKLLNELRNNVELNFYSANPLYPLGHGSWFHALKTSCSHAYFQLKTIHLICTHHYLIQLDWTLWIFFPNLTTNDHFCWLLLSQLNLPLHPSLWEIAYVEITLFCT